MKLATKKKFAVSLFLVGVVALTFSVKHYDFDKRVGAIYTENFGDKLDRALRKAAGPDAVECGRLRIKRNAQVDPVCAEYADAHQHSFYTSFAIETADQVAYRGIARNGQGAYTEFTWNPGDQADALFGVPDPAATACAAPPHANRRGVFTCSSEE